MNLPHGQKQFHCPRFCALEYRSSSLNESSRAPGPVLVIARLETHGDLSILVDPEWHTFVMAGDKERAAALIEDFAIRALSEPYSLLKQLCELNFGCLVTAATGEHIADNPTIAALVARFARVEIKEDC